MIVDRNSSPTTATDPSWPAGTDPLRNGSNGMPPSTPTVTVNGLSAGESRGYFASQSSSNATYNNPRVQPLLIPNGQPPPGPHSAGSAVSPSSRSISPDGYYYHQSEGSDQHAEQFQDEAQPRQSESSRFSLDSINSDERHKPVKSGGGGSIIGTKSVKTMKNLWRKSTGKKTAPVNNQPGVMAGRISPQPPLAPPLPHSRNQSDSRSSSRSTTPLTPSSASNGSHKNSESSSLNHFHFDQETPYPSYSKPPQTITSRPSVSETNIAGIGVDKPGTRRSMLKMFKNPSTSNLAPEPRPDHYRANSDQPRARRPSDAPLTIIKKSDTNHDMPPPSPRLPNQFSLGAWNKRQPTHVQQHSSSDAANFSTTSMVDVSGGYARSTASMESGDEISDSDFEILSQAQKQTNLYH